MATTDTGPNHRAGEWRTFGIERLPTKPAELWAHRRVYWLTWHEWITASDGSSRA
jgi:hypothetical protein